MVCLFQQGRLLLQVGELVVEVRVALHCRLRLVILKELAGLGLGRALQVGPALSDLLQFLLNDWTQLRLLLDQLLTLLAIESDNCLGPIVKLPVKALHNTVEIDQNHKISVSLCTLHYVLDCHFLAEWLFASHSYTPLMPAFASRDGSYGLRWLLLHLVPQICKRHNCCTELSTILDFRHKENLFLNQKCFFSTTMILGNW